MKLVITKDPNAFKRVRSRAEALLITPKDLRGPVLRELGMEHRKQQNKGFSSEGGTMKSGKWKALNPKYKERKAGRRRTLRAGVGGIKRFDKRTGSKTPIASVSNKILQLSGDMKARFTKKSNPNYVQRFSIKRRGKGVFEFGAQSDVAASHFRGKPGLARQSKEASRVFGGVAPQLPVRDMVTKTSTQIAAIRKRFSDWYKNKRIPQAFKRFPVAKR